jgi:catechol-2,3-dioxygenase
MPINISKMGHAVLSVTDLERSLCFYRDALGLSEVARRDFDGEEWVFLSAGNSHHDLALVEASPKLHHLAFNISGSLPELAETNASLVAAGIDVHATLDFRVSQALFVSDPDGNLIELYVDTPGEPWRAEPTLVANAAPLDLPDPG